MPWSREEDQLLKGIVGKNAEKPWAVVAKELNQESKSIERTGKQCRERWRNHLNPEIKKYGKVCKKSIEIHGKMLKI